jgi:membrane-anchored protein YejM (alkaline phosphatase superfamily)
MAWADIGRWASEGHIATVQDISQHALATLSTSQADLIYLHLPTPHPPAFWDRRTHTFAVGGSYLDSLDYSDRLLGQMLDILQAQPRWSATTVIVQGDHSWRTRSWRPVPGWSAEDERASHGGQWDPRPLLLIHLAGQQNLETVAAPTNLMFVHDVVAAQIQAIAR